MQRTCMRRGAVGARLVLAACLGAAAQGQYMLDLWTVDNGLPQNNVRGVLQSPDGYLWVTTSDGLARFDGVEFRCFDASNTPAIPSNRFSRAYDDVHGSLWFGSEINGVVRYQGGRFTHYAVKGDFVSSVGGDRDGTPLVFTGEALLRFDGRGFVPVAGVSPIDVLTSAMVVYPARRGGFWWTTRNSFHRYMAGRTTSWTEREGLPRTEVRTATEDRSGALWLTTSDGRLVRLKGRRAEVHREIAGLSVHAAWPVAGGEPTMVVRDGEGALWLLNLDTLTKRPFLAEPPAPVRDASSIRDVSYFQDRERNIWIATEGHGLFRARKQQITTYRRGENIYPVLAARSGQVWIGGHSGLSVASGGKVETFHDKAGRTLREIYTMHEDHHGRLWFAAGPEGLWVLEGGLLHRRREWEPQRHIATNTLSLLVDREGSMWLGTNRGLIRNQGGEQRYFSREDGVAPHQVNVVIQSRDGAIWAGGYGGLTRYRDGRFTSWTAKDGLPADSVRALYEDQEGVLWAGTYDGGLGRYADGRWTRCTVREGLHNSGVFQILEDAGGNFWMSCNRGIYRVRKQELTELAAGRRQRVISVAYGKSDGMANAECNGGRWPAGAIGRDGRLWFPTQDGVVALDPRATSTDTRPPPVVIESALVERALMPADRPLLIPAGVGGLQIKYTALSFQHPEQLRFRYRLEGVDRDWIDAGTRRIAYYSHLPPGTHQFRVTAADRDGVWNPAEQTLMVSVTAPFYQTWWFLAASVLITLGLLGYGQSWRVQKLERARAVQQAFSRRLMASQEEERKRIAAELHDSLGQRLVIIRNLALLSLRGGDPRERIEEMSSEASRAIGEVREISYNLRPYQLDRLGLTRAIEALVKIASRASATSFTADVENVDGFFAKEEEIHFYRIVQEGLNNVLKHAEATQAEMQIRRQEGSVLLTIRDDGRGFVPGSATTAPAGFSPGGFGLVGINERARAIGGRSWLHSVPGQGTTMMVEVRRSSPAEQMGNESAAR